MVKFYKNIISYVIYCLVMFSVMILSIRGEILQNTISYLFLVMISVMILSITG